MPTLHRRLISAWIAIGAILLSALMPTVSMALEGVRDKSTVADGSWIEVCSIQGSSWVRMAADGRVLATSPHKPLDAPASAHGEHCPYCLHQAASFALPPPQPFVLPVWPHHGKLLALKTPSAPLALAWLTPAARAPPTRRFDRR